jgi:TPR repeat protein
VPWVIGSIWGVIIVWIVGLIAFSEYQDYVKRSAQIGVMQTAPASPAQGSSGFDPARAVPVTASDVFDPARAIPVTARDMRPFADQGHSWAQYILGEIYDNGQGVSQDNAEAAKWYRKAADQGHANAQYNLGVMYSTGQGVPQDYVEAHKWFNLAASRLTDSERDTAVKKRALMESKMTQSQIAEAQKLAREWKSR